MNAQCRMEDRGRPWCALTPWSGPATFALMHALRWIQVAATGLVCLILAATLAGGGRPWVIAPDPAPARAALGPPDPDPARAAFQGMLTPDDVARGVWDLGVAPGAPVLDPARAAALAAPLARAREAHVRLAGLRTERRRLEALVLEDGMRIAEITRGHTP